MKSQPIFYRNSFLNSSSLPFLFLIPTLLFVRLLFVVMRTCLMLNAFAQYGQRANRLFATVVIDPSMIYSSIYVDKPRD